MKKYIYVFLFALIVFGAGIVLGNITYRDKDASPVADRKLRNEDGLIRAMNTSNVEGRYISNNSLEYFPAGTAGAPSITFSGQTTDGLFSKSATQLGFTVDGVESGFIDNNGSLTLTGGDY